jgi:hypothetical protein
MQIFCGWIIRNRILVHNCCNAFLSLSFLKSFAKVSCFCHKYFAKMKSEFSRKLLWKNKNENFRPNPNVDDGFLRSFYADDGIFRHIHVLVLRHAWFFYSIYAVYCASHSCHCVELYGGELSWWWVVRVMSCHGGELSEWLIVREAGWRVVRWRIVWKIVLWIRSDPHLSGRALTRIWTLQTGSGSGFQSSTKWAY